MVLEETTHSTDSNNDIFLCRCDCGSLCEITRKQLNKRKNSCGCLRHKNTSKHVMGTKIYSVWRGMVSRCYYVNDSGYVNYGGRGVKICDEWRSCCDSFYKWSLSNGYVEGYSIERIDVNGDYCPENCTWIPLKEQAKNRRTSDKYLGITQADWARRLGATSLTYYKKLYGNLEQAVRAYILTHFI